MELSEKIFQELENKKISIEELNDQYFIDSQHEIESDNISKLLNENICDFKEIVDKFINDLDLCYLLQKSFRNEKLFEELIQNNKFLSQENVRYLLNKIDEDYELEDLCANTSLIKHILNEFILDKEDVDRLNTIIENSSRCKKENIHNIFELTEHENKSNKEVLKLTELNKRLYTFDVNEDQKFEMIELIQNNEIARNRLIQIIENNLEDQYDFEKLKSLLTKDEEKKKIKLNF